ncbi:WD repeat-containing protein 11 isoform X2 [Phoenix dactylifera]|uniref:WD repeat-containing protein 11 isoform X2 n=1 Tax=Phoenix dactylifera TaxID=42345 RepID=A0A8B7CYC0_PHODC|nr:WD repeat-containing protein 11 isoform X2 [Phoenix dactylifera]
MASPRSQEAWDCMLPGPPSRSNGGSADCSPSGLLAYGAGSSVVVADPRSMQLVSVLPMPPPHHHHSSSGGGAATSSSTSPHALAPFVTSVRWSPQPLSRDLSALDDASNSHLRLAVGDRQGRIALWDFRSRQVLLWLDLDSSADRSRLGIQDLCWVRSDSWLLASIHGPSLLALWNAASGRCLWKYDAAPEYLSCIRRDPFDSRHFCTLGLRGFLLSAIALGGGAGGVDGDVSIQEHQVSGIGDLSDLQKIEREAGGASPSSPALALFPLFFARFCFSPRWRHILLITFPKEFIVFDLQYGASLSSTPLPRGCGKFFDLVPDPDLDLLYCAHLDGKLSIWKRKEGEQVHVLCTMEELMPSIGTAVPSPAVLAITLCQSESAIQNVVRLCSESSYTQSSLDLDYASPKSLYKEMDFGPKSHLISISDDGKIWNWLLTSDKARDAQKASLNINKSNVVGEELASKTHTRSTDNLLSRAVPDADKEPEPVGSSCVRLTNSNFIASEFSMKISLTGQLHLLSSTVTTLAVPSPSLIATLARGGNKPAPAVPLVALGTQSGTIDVIDVSANAVAVSFSVHSSIIRGLKWLGNSRLVSFSYSQVNDKGGGYNNRLVITCLRSGLNRTFRVLQKPERAPIRALRASSSGRYILILFRDAPVEVWAMTKNPIMLRSLALPFTVLEWTLPSAPRPNQSAPSRQSSLSSKERSYSATATATSMESTTSSESSGDDTSESFAFALVNGALGVFEVHGRRIRDFRPKWPSSSFVSSDGLITAMAYRLPHVVMGDRLGNIRWWDVTTGLSSSFTTHREGIRRIKFSPVVSGDRSRGRIAVLFYDNTFSIFDLDTSDPLANALLQPQSPGTLVLELDWLPTRTNKNEPLVLCIAGADSSFRLIEVNINDAKNNSSFKPRVLKERFRPMPLCLPILLPTAHALALRMILQLGVKSSWFSKSSTTADTLSCQTPETCPTSVQDLRNYMIDSTLPAVGDSVVPELLLKVLEPYRKEGCILDDERARLYSSVSNKGSAARFAFAAAVFGEFSEALFWLQLPQALCHSVDKSENRSLQEVSKSSVSEAESLTILNRIASRERSVPGRATKDMNCGQLNFMAFKPEELQGNANERIPWHEKLDGEEAIQKRVHELVSVGDLEAAVSLLLSTPPEGSQFYPNALRAVALSSAVSRSLHELAVKVIAANMVRTDKSLSGTHLLCAVGRYQEACSQLQDAGWWTDAATLAATHLHGSDYARVLQRWADYVLYNEHNIWRALILYVAAGALPEALSALRNAQQPDTAAMFLLACHEINAQIASKSRPLDEQLESSLEMKQKFHLPSRNLEDEDLIAVSEYYGQYQRKLVHLCMDAVPLFD